MKKFILIFLMFLMLVGCGSSPNPIVINEEKVVQNEIKYNILYARVGNTIYPTIKKRNYTYFETSKGGRQFLEIIVEVENLTDEDINLAECFEGNMVVSKRRYNLGVVGEEGANTVVSLEAILPPMEKTIVHFYSEIPEENLYEEAELELSYKGEVIEHVTFHASEILEVIEEKQNGDSVVIDGVLEMMFYDPYMGNNVAPFIAESYHVFTYDNDNPENTIWGIQKLWVKNLGDEAIDLDDFVTLEASYNDVIIYQSNAAFLETVDRKNMDTLEVYIEPNEARYIYLVVSVPLNDKDEAMDFTVSAYNRRYMVKKAETKTE